MADHLPITQGSGATVATDQIGGSHYQRIKVSDGTADSENHWVIGSDGSGQMTLKGNVTIDSLPNVTVGSALPAGDNNIGNVDVVSNTAWSDPNTYLGLVTVSIGAENTVAATFGGNVSLNASDAFIGLVSVSGFTSPLPVDATGQGDVPITLDGEAVVLGAGSAAIGKLAANSGVDIGDVDVASNTAWSDPNTYIGLVTVGNEVAINDGGNVITVDGTVTANLSSTDNTVLDNIQAAVETIDNAISGSEMQVDVVAAIPAGDNNIGNVDIASNTAWSDPNTFVGLATTVNAYKSSSTVFTWVGSTSGAATVATPPASNRFFIQNIHVASMGDSLVEIRSGATTLIPFTALATQGGYSQHYGEDGLPSRSQDDAFVVYQNSAATLSVMANIRFGA